jgi:acid phosphatase family membrane protein YuiD
MALCVAATQVIKLMAYSLTRRHLAFAALGQSHGLPSSPAAVLSCLLMLMILREGILAAETGFALVFAVIVIHDTVKLRIAARRQREVVFRIVESLDHAGPFRQRVADYLDPRTHHPAHVVLGVLFGGLFALAFGLPSG